VASILKLVNICRCNLSQPYTQIGFALPCKDLIWLKKKLAKDKHTSLFGTFVSDQDRKVLKD